MDIVCIWCCRVRVDWTEIDLADGGERNVKKLNEIEIEYYVWKICSKENMKY